MGDPKLLEQLKDEIIPALEKVSGRAYDEDRLKEHLRLAAQAEDDLVWDAMRLG